MIAYVRSNNVIYEIMSSLNDTYFMKLCLLTFIESCILIFFVCCYVDIKLETLDCDSKVFVLCTTWK